MFSLKKILDNQTLVFTLGGIIPALLNFTFLPFYSFILTPEDFGLFSYVMSFQSILLVLTSLSLNTFILRKYFETDTVERRKLFGSIFIFLFFYNLVLVVCLLLIFPYLIPNLTSTIPFYPYFLLMIAGLFFEFIFIFPMIIFRVEKLAKWYVVFSVAKQICTFIIAYIAIEAFELGILGRFIAIFSVNLIFAFISLFIISQHSDLRYKKPLIYEGLRFSAPIIPAAILGTIYVALDKLLLINYLSLDQLGIYTLAASLASVINFVSLGYYRAVEPVIFESFKSEYFLKKVNDISRVLLIILLPSGLLLSLFSSDILFYFFNDNFHLAFIFVPFFIISLILEAQRRILGTILHAYKVTKYDLPIRLVSICCYIVFFLLLVPKFGVFSALWALILGAMAGLLTTLLILKKYIKVNNYLLYTMPVLCTFLFIPNLLQNYFSSENYVFIIFKLLISLIIFIAIWLYFRRNKNLIPN